MKKSIIGILALLGSLLLPAVSLAANGAALVQVPVTSGHCAQWISPNILSDSGGACGAGGGYSGGDFTIYSGGHAGMTLTPSYQSTTASGILGNVSAQPIYMQKNVATTGGDIADVFVRRTSNYVGGTGGFVNSGLKIEDDVSAGTTANEWAMLALLDSNSTAGDNSENVATYAQARKHSTGKTWAEVMELWDYNANPTFSSVVDEHDLRATGTDNNNNRILQDNWAVALDGTTSTNVAYGIRFNTDTHTFIGTGIRFNGNYGSGIDFTNASLLANNAIILADGHHVCFEGTCGKYLYHSGSNLYFHTSGGNVVTLSDTGAVTAASLSVGAIASSSSIDASTRLSVTGGNYVCLDGSSCSYKLFESSGLMQAAYNATGLWSVNVSTGVFGIGVGAAYAVGFSTGVSCSGSPSGSFQSVGGIVTHC